MILVIGNVLLEDTVQARWAEWPFLTPDFVCVKVGNYIFQKNILFQNPTFRDNELTAWKIWCVFSNHEDGCFPWLHWLHFFQNPRLCFVWPRAMLQYKERNRSFEANTWMSEWMNEWNQGQILSTQTFYWSQHESQSPRPSAVAQWKTAIASGLGPQHQCLDLDQAAMIS